MIARRHRPILSLALFGIVLIAAVVTGIVAATHTFRNRELANSERELKNTALILAEQTDRAFQSLDLVLISVIERMQSLGINSPEDFERQMSGQDVQLILKDKISGLPHIDAVSLINVDGRMINISRFWPVPDISIADRAHFQAFKSKPELKSLISDPVRNRATGTWTVFLARRFTDANGRFLGLLHGAMELAYFEKLFGSVVLGDQSSISLQRGDGILLARHPRVEAAVGASFSDATNALGTLDAGSIRLMGKMDGKERLLSAHRLAHYSLVIAVSTGADAALAGWRAEVKFLIGAGAFAVFAITIICLLIVRQLSRAHRWSRKTIALERQRLDTAINNMSLGLLLFDSSRRIVVCNQRYIALYGLSPDVVRPGLEFRDLIAHRKETGSFAGDVDKYCSAIFEDFAQQKFSEVIAETSDGRLIRIVNQPVASGGWVATHEDITNQQRLLQAQSNAERVLQEQKLLLDVALNNMVQGLCMFDAEGRIRLFNQRYVDIMNLSAGDLMGLSLLDLFQYRKAIGQFTGNPEQVFGHILADMRSGKSVTQVMVSNEGRALRVVDRPLAGGGWVATFEDITEQRKIEQERDRDREFLTQIIDNVPVMIAVKDASTRKFILANRAAEALWGLSRAEVVGKSTRELFSKAQADIIDTYDDEALLSDTPLVLDAHPNMARSGDQRTVTSKRLAIRDSIGKPQFLISVVEDVTERKLVEQERDRDRAFLNQIINNVPVTIIAKHARSRKYVLVNQSGEKYFGLSRDQIIGKTAHEILPKVTADIVTDHDEKLLNSDGYLIFEEHQSDTLHNDSCFVTSKKLVIRDGNAEPQYLLGVIEDVTERKRSADRIAHLAHYDSLTDLPNRVLFREQLQQALRWVDRGDRLAVLYLDLQSIQEHQRQPRTPSR